MAYVVAGIELIGGIALIIGLGTRVVSALIGIIMIGSVNSSWLVRKWPTGCELDLAILAIAISCNQWK
ncbi:DoxX family protein [Cytobacillus oceanisediminis]|uniref:DoxX family protein n=1 Tax=Cytobacillus oceanisediminis TaxID=665099 RepID=UPI0030D11B29